MMLMKKKAEPIPEEKKKKEDSAVIPPGSAEQTAEEEYMGHLVAIVESSRCRVRAMHRRWKTEWTKRNCSHARARVRSSAPKWRRKLLSAADVRPRHSRLHAVGGFARVRPPKATLSEKNPDDLCRLRK